MLQKLSKKQVKDIVNRTYPEYKGRKFYLDFRKQYTMQDYWSEGTRYYVKAINENGEIGLPNPSSHNPFNNIAHTSFEIPLDICLVEHAYIGNNQSIRFIFHPDTNLLPKLLKEE